MFFVLFRQSSCFDCSETLLILDYAIVNQVIAAEDKDIKHNLCLPPRKWKLQDSIIR